MTKLVVVDWDTQELRTAVGLHGRGGLKNVTCAAMTWDEAEQKGLTAGSFEAVASLLGNASIARGRGLLIARRQHLESTTLNVPPATDDELPDLVENFLATGLAMGSEEVRYDYFPLDNAANSARRIAITAVERATAEQYCRLAEQLKLSRPRLTIRAAGVASIIRRRFPGAQGSTLAIVPNVEEVDLALIGADRLWYWRSVYCSPTGESESFRKFVAAEVVRTLTVAEDHLPENETISRVAVVLGANEKSAVVDALREAVQIPVEVAAPEPEGIPVEYEAGAESTGRFAPLVGTLLDEVEHDRLEVDLLHPRVRPKKRQSRRPAVLGALAVATAIGLGAFVLWEEVTQQQSRAAQLDGELQRIEESIEKVDAQAQTWRQIQAWNQANVVWLDELRDLATRFPAPGNAVLLDFTASPASSGGAVIRFSAKATDPAVVSALDRDLRDSYREILSRNLREQAVAPGDPFLWRFESLINTRRRPQAAYRRPQSFANGDPGETL